MKHIVRKMTLISFVSIASFATLFTLGALALYCSSEDYFDVSDEWDNS